MADYAQDVVLLAFKFIFLNIIFLNCCPLWGYWLNICLDSCLSSFLFLMYWIVVNQRRRDQQINHRVVQ